MTKRSGSVAAARVEIPETGPYPVAPLDNTIRRDDMEELWDLAMSLPPVQEMTALNWHRYLPCEVGAMFLAVATVAECRLKGDEMWHQLDEFGDGILRAEAEARHMVYLVQIEKRFRDYYGDYDKTPRGLVKVLTDLELVKIYQRRGKDVVEFPENLPRPDDKLGLCHADLQEPVVFKARYRKNGGPRNRVMMNELPAVRRMLNTGWARHLPPELTYAFMSTAAVSAGGCTGDNMWENIEDLWEAQMKSKHQLFPKNKAGEVIERFSQEYSGTYVHTARGAIDVLLELGLLVKSQIDDKDYLEVPEVLPTPEMRLVLSEEERLLLAERLKMRI